MPTKRWRLLSWENLEMNLTPKIDWSYQVPATRVWFLNQYGGQRQSWGSQAIINCSTEDVMEGDVGALKVNIMPEDNQPGHLKLSIFFSDGGDSDYRWMHSNVAAYENRMKDAGQPYTQYEFDTYDKLVCWIKPPADWFLDTRTFEDTFWANYNASSCDWSGFNKPNTCNHGTGYDSHAHRSKKEVAWREDPNPGEIVNGQEWPDGFPQPRGHPYHWFGPCLPGAWNQFIVDERPTYSYDSKNSGRKVQRTRYPYDNVSDRGGDCGDTTHNWWDCAIYYYCHFAGGGFMCPMSTGYDSPFYFGTQTLYQDPYPKDTACVNFIASVSGAYRADLGTTGNGEVHVSWENGRQNRLRVEVRWSFADIHANGWDSASKFTQHHGRLFTDTELTWDENGDPLTFGWPVETSTMPTSPYGVNERGYPTSYSEFNATSPCRHFWSDEIVPGANEYVYIALRPVEASMEPGDFDPLAFRQICIPFTDGAYPPHLKD